MTPKTAANNRWKAKNKDAVNAMNRRYCERHREQVRAWKRAEYRRNRDKYLARVARFRRENPEEASARKKAEYLKHRDKYIARSVEWCRENKHKCAQHRATMQAKKFRNEYEDCSAQIAILRLAKHCFWCGCDLTDKNRTIDHVVPMSRGGPHNKHNIVASCRSCNSSKNYRLPEEWRNK